MPPKTATTAQQSRDKSERIRDQAARKAQEKQAAADELARNPPPEGKKTGKKGNGTTGRGKKKDDQQHPKGGRGNVKAAANKNAAKMTKDTQTTDPQQANRNESQAATSIFKPGLIHYLDLLPPYMRNDPQGVQDVITDLKRKAGVLEGADGDEEPEEPEGQQRPPKKKRKGHYGKPTHDKRGNDDSDDDDGAPGPSGSRGNASEPINVETAGENDDENAEEDGDRDNGRAPETPVDEATRAAEQEEEEVDTPESAEHPPAKRSETKATENEQEKPPPAYPEGFKRKGKQKATEEPAGSGDATLQAAARKIARNPSKMAGKGPIKCVTPSLTQKGAAKRSSPAETNSLAESSKSKQTAKKTVRFSETDMAGSSSLNDIAAGFPNPDREEGEISEDDMMNEGDVFEEDREYDEGTNYARSVHSDDEDNGDE